MWTLKLFSLSRICRDRLVTTSWAVGWLKTGVNASHCLLQHVDRSPWSIYLKATSTTRWVLRTPTSGPSQRPSCSLSLHPSLQISDNPSEFPQQVISLSPSLMPSLTISASPSFETLISVSVPIHPTYGWTKFSSIKIVFINAFFTGYVRLRSTFRSSHFTSLNNSV